MKHKSFICKSEIEFDRVYSLRFCTEYDILFSKYRIELLVVLSATTATKMTDFQ